MSERAGRLISTSQSSEESRRRAKRTKRLLEQQLPSVRAAAEKWRNGTTLASALTTLGGFLGAPTRIDMLATGWRTTAGITLAITATCIVASLACSMRASFGWPRKIVRDRADWYEQWEANEIATASGYLAASMVLAAIAAIGVGVFVGVLFFTGGTGSP
ncbi:hypothetical protein [Curtobacterium sp. GD1]|uniref:hypothetical protein n=1 Tax=Curtobacterium sp. GD1 TaxID=2810612 RepID=UPI001E4DAA0D|nr:hypothetical protein [Curtobacterium sp. GD1]MCC8906408.1 hypothetical protein [Curtobacterium sp. GD1]